jgi:hypothetical protein
MDVFKLKRYIFPKIIVNSRRANRRLSPKETYYQKKAEPRPERNGFGAKYDFQGLAFMYAGPGHWNTCFTAET